MDIVRIIRLLARQRPMFHSEADFQLALAWEIQKQHPHYSIRLEYKPKNIPDRIFLDIYIENKSEQYAIELKYKTRAIKHQHGKELFTLLDQSAQDIGRFDFLYDVGRLEQVVGSQKKTNGYALLITNDFSYWNKSNRKTVDSDFRLHEGRKIKGNLKWGSKASMGTKKGRNFAIKLHGIYNAKWQNYSCPSDDKYGTFKYLLFRITK
jgi:hypothetical protein